MSAAGCRKIIHVDMDAFFASVEQRDDPCLRGKPLVVAGASPRSVVAAASYEAREFGIRSALPTMAAKQRCAELLIVPPRFDVYREVSRQIRSICARHTPLIEPLSLDEAYLDVTENIQGLPTATDVANDIRAAIFNETGLTASAGVSYNKFLAKLGSGYKKPNGMTIIRPGRGEALVADLEVSRFHGIGPATAARMTELGIRFGRDLRSFPFDQLQRHFGKSAAYYHAIAHGEDNRPVRPDRTRKSYGAENTFEQDIGDRGKLLAELSDIADHLWEDRARIGRDGRTVTLKAKYRDFELVTRSRTLSQPMSDRLLLGTIVEELLDSLLPLSRPLRLVGISISNLVDKEAERAQQSQMALAL
ncbi:DNA polymerase IV [Sphingosinicella sp. BN140058]|uniref:DNA polymerase IV n=1 Tax=Sphingosinicella sp. BN140058 TaxID=1892855 RepID=UPI0010111FD5|nr:DNA polymerase IV [Sphingosinicella sp. BN140058]QAY80400.1 DNA polymerase IV [Sphingosinicella sp. BN140058]